MAQHYDGTEDCDARDRQDELSQLPGHPRVPTTLYDNDQCMKTNFTTTDDVPARTADLPAKARMTIQTIGRCYYWRLSYSTSWRRWGSWAIAMMGKLVPDRPNGSGGKHIMLTCG
jgi:hypothetical protein